MKHFLLSLFVFPAFITTTFLHQEATASEPQNYFQCDCSSIRYPFSHHWIYALSAFQDSVAIEDGSVWQTNSYQTYLLRDWLANDSIVITQNREWFSSYKYRIVNQNLGLSITANLSLGPILDNPYSRYIVFIDPVNNIVMLSDNTRWSISSFDDHLLYKWALNDYIIIGENSGWDFSHPYILINSNMDNYIHAKQY